MPLEMNFKEFLNGSANIAASAAPKPWSMDKDQIMQYWQNLNPSTPVFFDPIEPGKRGSTFGEDGLRLTGSRRFIDSVLGRLKDIMQYENPSTKLSLTYRQVEYRGNQTPNKSTSFVFYAQAKKREEQKPTQGMSNGPHLS